MANEQAESVKIVVEIVDKFTKPLQDLRRSLERVEKTGEGANKVKRAFDGLRISILDTAKIIQSGLTPALSAFGIGALSVTGAITGLVVALRGFASSTEILSRLSRETGFSIDKMREWEAVGRRLGGSAEENAKGFRSFHEQMRLLRLGLGNTPEFSSRGLGKQYAEIRGMKDDTQAFAKVIDVLDHIKEPAEKRIWLRLFGLPERWADMLASERDKVIADWRKVYGPTTKAGEQAAKNFQDAMAGIGNAWAGLMHRMAESGTLSELTNLINEFHKIITDPDFGRAMVKVFNELKNVTLDIVNVAKIAGLIVKRAAEPDTGKADTEHETYDRMRHPERWKEFDRSMEEAAKRSDPLPRTKPGMFTYGGEAVPLAKTVEELRKSLGLGTSKEDQKTTIKEGTAEGIVEGFTKMALLTGPAGAGGPGGSFGGANVIRASLGPSGGPRGGRSSASAANPMGDQAAGGPMSVEPNQSDRPSHTQGTVTVGGQTFGWASGGMKRGSIPFGDYPVNIGKGDIGSIGKRIGSIATLGGRGGVIPDPKYPGHPRVGVQIHPGSSNLLDRLYTEGCFGIEPAQWPAFKKALLDEAKKGPLTLHIGRDGKATILPRADTDAQKKPQVPVPRDKLHDGAARTQSARVDGSANVRIDLAGVPGGGTHMSSTSGVFSEIELHRGNTMPLASESA